MIEKLTFFIRSLSSCSAQNLIISRAVCRLFVKYGQVITDVSKFSRGLSPYSLAPLLRRYFKICASPFSAAITAAVRS